MPVFQNLGFRAMAVSNAARLTLEEFLALPETKPASEYIEGDVIQKPMPKTRHLKLQAKLIEVVNAVAKPTRIAYAFPELRCSFANHSIIPDVAVLRWPNIHFDADGEPLDDVLTPPDWTIEILSPEQSANRVTGNILYCLAHGCELGWLVDPGDCIARTESLSIGAGVSSPATAGAVLWENTLAVLDVMDLSLTAAQVFGWLQMNRQ